jgi:hypothetical protein
MSIRNQSIPSVRRSLIAALLSTTLILGAMAGCATRLETATESTKAPSASRSVAPTATSDGAIGVLIDGALGREGGFLIGMQPEKADSKYHDEALLAAHNAEVHPATSSDVKNSDSADLNDDGFVTMDELVAMRDAGLNNDELIRRLKKTNQIFELTRHQKSFLLDDAISEKVIDAMPGLNRAALSSTVERAKEPASPERSSTPIDNRTEER